MTSNWLEALQNKLAETSVDIANAVPADWQSQAAEAFDKVKNIQQSDIDNARSRLAQEIPRRMSTVVDKVNEVKDDIQRSSHPLIAALKEAEIPPVSKKLFSVFLALDDYTQRHPFRTGLPLVLFFGPKLIRAVSFMSRLGYALVLHALGFTNRGISRGSFASGYESQHYTYGAGGIRSNSTFAYMQSAGARGPPGLGLWSIIDWSLGIWGIHILKRHYMG